MLHTYTLMPGITLRCFRDGRFKQGRLVVRLIRPMDMAESAMNTLLPTVWCLGTADRPNMRLMANHFTELYGMGAGPVSTRVGDYHAFGLGSSFLDDRYAFDGGDIFGGATDFLKEMIRRPLLVDGVFPEDILEREKENLISDIEAVKNDKPAFAAARLQFLVGRQDSVGIPRLGTVETVSAVTAPALTAYYHKVLQESPIELFYVGDMEPEKVRDITAAMFTDMTRDPITLPPQTSFRAGDYVEKTELMDVNQARIAMCLSAPCTCRDEDYMALRVMNSIFGGSAVSKLFTVIREQMSLCYDISSSVSAGKGIIMLGAGVDNEQVEPVREQILLQLEACRRGEITAQELQAAKASIEAGLRVVHDTAGRIEATYYNQHLMGSLYTPERQLADLQQVTTADVAEMAQRVVLRGAYVMKGAK